MHIERDVALAQFACEVRKNLVGQFGCIEGAALRLALVPRHLLEGLNPFGSTPQIYDQLRGGVANMLQKLVQARASQIAARQFGCEQLDLALKGRSHRQADADGAIDFMGNSRHQAPQRGKLFGFDQRVLGLTQMSQSRLGGILGLADFLLGPLALGDLLGGNIDGNDLATRRTQRVPIGNPGTLLDLIGVLACNLNPYHRFTRFHDRPNDLLDRICQRRHAVSDKAAKMILNRNAADLGETLVDLQVTAIRRQACKPDGSRVVDELKRGLLREQQHIRCG